MSRQTCRKHTVIVLKQYYFAAIVFVCLWLAAAVYLINFLCFYFPVIPDYLFKFLIIGSAGSGKSCLLHHFIENKCKLEQEKRDKFVLCMSNRWESWINIYKLWTYLCTYLYTCIFIYMRDILNIDGVKQLRVLTIVLKSIRRH